MHVRYCKYTCKYKNTLLCHRRGMEFQVPNLKISLSTICMCHNYNKYEMYNTATLMNELHSQVESSNFKNYKLKKLGNCSTSIFHSLPTCSFG